MNTAKALITIVDRGKGEAISAFTNKKYPQISFIAMGTGTASSEIMDLLGLDSADKDVIFSLVGAHELDSMLSEISGRKLIRSAGAGIAFTLPLGGISGLIHAALTHGAPQSQEVEMTENKDKAKNQEAFSLVAVVADPGYSDTIMDLARSGGARGGTVIYMRGIGNEGAGKFLGINLQEEKELVLILASAEDRLNIMKSINDGFGVRSEAKAVVFSLPVEDMIQVS